MGLLSRSGRAGLTQEPAAWGSGLERVRDGKVARRGVYTNLPAGSKEAPNPPKEGERKTDQHMNKFRRTLLRTVRLWVTLQPSGRYTARALLSPPAA